MKLYFSSLLLLVAIGNTDAVRPLPWKDKTPASKGKNGNKVPFTIIKSVDRVKVAKEDEEREARGDAPRFAIPNKVVIDPSNSGQWETANDGTQIWRYRTKSPGCNSQNFGFTTYQMPKGGEMFIHDTKGRTSMTRSFTSKDNAPSGELWTPVIETCDATIEVNLDPKTNKEDLKLTLGYVNIGYRGFHTRPEHEHGTKRRELSGSCNVDVVCSASDGYPDIDDWRTQIPSAAVYSTGGSTFCSGTAINNKRNDGIPFFLTANHCSITPSNAASLVTYWNYETSTCGGTPNGVLDQFTIGAEHLVSYPASDVTLLRLTSSIDESFGVTLAGWDTTPNAANGVVAIHHPSTDEKRISFEYQPTSISSYSGNAGSGTTHIRVNDWDSGTTEPGSSGSALFDITTKRIVGQLHGGGAACGNNSPDWYGRFYISWNNGLKEFLDPDNDCGSGSCSTDTITSNGSSSAPTLSPPPTQGPTPCVGMDVQVNLQTDNWPQETAWTITNDCEEGALVQSNPAYPDQATFYTNQYCLPDAKYTFTITDSYGDGTCCGYGEGSVEVTVDGSSSMTTTAMSSGEFGSSTTTSFGSCGSNPDTPNPTRSPSKAPSVSPSSNPTEVPTGSPSKEPTKVPSLSPSKSPSKGPSLSPSKSPSTSPSGSPSSSPTEPDVPPPEPTDPPVSSSPSTSPSKEPSVSPTKAPTDSPSSSPTKSPSKAPTLQPTSVPTLSPTPGPTLPPDSCEGISVQVDLLTDDYPSETAWTIVNNCDGSTVASNPQLSAATPYLYEDCLPEAEYTFTITDSYGDGICCGYGSGSVEVIVDGNIAMSSGDFGSSTSTSFGSCGSTSPTKSPSSKPTLSPITENPTESPTPKPTNSPVSLPPPGTDDEFAVYDPAYGAPHCEVIGKSCSSGNLLVGRRGLNGGNEPNSSNTLDGRADGSSGTFQGDESLDMITVSTLNGGPLTAGQLFNIKVDVWAWSTGSSDSADFYYTNDATATPIVWTYLNTLGAGGPDQRTLNLPADLYSPSDPNYGYTLSNGPNQAVRVRFRYNGSVCPGGVWNCNNGSYDDIDDLMFTVAPAAPESSTASSPWDNSKSDTSSFKAAAAVNVPDDTQVKVTCQGLERDRCNATGDQCYWKNMRKGCLPK